MTRLRQLGLLAAGVLALTGCKREIRDYRPSPPFAPGSASETFDEQNAFALSEGKRLFLAMNCSGCHSLGGGAIGPPLMDEKWIYGAEPQQVFETIAGGRGGGMPAFGGGPRDRPDGVTVVGELPDYQIWQLVAYVRSLSGQASPNAAPGRSDHMEVGPPENSREREWPVMAPPPEEKPK